jgi:DNA-binding XRE family transcriptional regulator
MSLLSNEDEADLALYDERKAELAADGAGSLPADVSLAMLRGESRVKAIRKWRQVRQTDLADRIGISQGALSDIEAGRRKGSATTLAALARELDVPLAWIA